MMPYSVRRSPPSAPALLASLFVVTAQAGARVLERPSLNSQMLTTMPRGTLFSGLPTSGRWVRRLGGGYCVDIAVREVR